jgi:hypothetical protein
MVKEIDERVSDESEGGLEARIVGGILPFGPMELF